MAYKATTFKDLGAMRGTYNDNKEGDQKKNRNNNNHHNRSNSHNNNKKNQKTNEDLGEKSFAPYNFIPFHEGSVPKLYKSMQSLPTHNNLKGDYTGYICFSMENLTDFIVGGTHSKIDGSIASHINFARDANGNFIIPGSSVRGFVRSHAELLSGSYTDFIEDITFLYRKFACNSKALRKQYCEELKPENGSDDAMPMGVKAGIIYKETVGGEEVYKIRVTKKFAGKNGEKNFIQVHERLLRESQILLDTQYMYMENMKTVNKKYHPYRGKRVAFDYDVETGAYNFGKGHLSGEILNSAFVPPAKNNKGGQSKTKKVHHYLVMSEYEKDENGNYEEYTIEHVRIQNYRNDFEKYRDKKNTPDFYTLPKNDGISNGKVFFFKAKVDTKEVESFGPTPYFRIFFKKSVKNGVRGDHTKDGFDFVQSLFGFISNGDAYKSRLSFGNLVIEDKNAKTTKFRVCSGKPSPTAVHMYLDQEGKNRETLNTYNDDFKLRGQKIYLKRSKTVDGVVRYYKYDPVTDRKILVERFTSELETVAPKNVFTGKIYFENLTKEELGLILYCLEFDNCEKESYSIGNSKAYGYGRIKIKDISLHVFDAAERFTTLTLTAKNRTEDIPRIKKSYAKKMKEEFDFDFYSENNESVYMYRKLAQTEVFDDYLQQIDTVYMNMKEYAKMNPLETLDGIINKH